MVNGVETVGLALLHTIGDLAKAADELVSPTTAGSAVGDPAGPATPFDPATPTAQTALIMGLHPLLPDPAARPAAAGTAAERSRSRQRAGRSAPTGPEGAGEPRLRRRRRGLLDPGGHRHADLQLIEDNLFTNPLDAIGLPIAADIGLLTLAGGLEYQVLADASTQIGSDLTF